MKITQTTNDQLKKSVMEAVIKAYKLAGYNVPPARDLAETVNMMADDLRKYFRNNDTADIATAFERGALGDFGEYQGLSVARFHQWMKTYNGKATNQHTDDEDEQPQAPQPPRDRVADGHSMVNSAYQEWLRRGYNLIPATIILQWLIADNKIPELRKKTLAAREQATASLNAQYQKKREPFQKLIDFIKSNQQTECDALLLEAYFEECKAAGIETLYND